MKTKKNLLEKRDQYNRYYGDFRGVDFSSDHTQVIDQRLAYAVNMYKDYQSAQGKAIETIAGFRRRVVIPDGTIIYGIHYFTHKSDNQIVSKVLIHAGEKLYLWHNYPKSIGVLMHTSAVLSLPTDDIGGMKTYSVKLSDDVKSIQGVHTSNGDTLLNTTYDTSEHVLTLVSSVLNESDVIQIDYYEGTLQEAIYSEMNARKSESFVFNNRLYIIDGKNYVYYDGDIIKSVLDDAYIPTTYINIEPNGASAGFQYEYRNILQPKFKNTFIADGSSKEFFLNEKIDSENVKIKVYGKDITEGYTVVKDDAKIVFNTAPKKPEESGFPEKYAGIEITAQRDYGATEITKCTLFSIFDDRVFLSGNPDHHNTIYFCGTNSEAGRIDPSYFPVFYNNECGVGNAAITGLLVVANTLMALKSDTQQDGSVYFLSPVSTGNNLYPRRYDTARGLAGTGCLGACVNFLDDPVFISRLGLEGVSSLQIASERIIEHRSSLVDAKLVNLDLRKAFIEEWNGYLFVFVDGKVFMADSRQRFTHDTGVMQYEWYYLEGIGVCDGQYLAYRYASVLPTYLEGVTITHDDSVDYELAIASNVIDPELLQSVNLCNSLVNPPDNDGNESAKVYSQIIEIEQYEQKYKVRVDYTIKDGKAYLCETNGEYIGGIFKEACVAKSFEDNMFFGTLNGVICSFNFDKRNEMGEIPVQYYSFDGRAIICGCATKMDCCGIPHLTKSTVKKSTVIKTKSLQESAAKIKIRTNKKPYTQIARINSSVFSFDNLDFSDFSFSSNEQSLFSIKEKEKQWVEKQYYIYSDEYLKPFALYYISYRYNVAGRFKG